MGGVIVNKSFREWIQEGEAIYTAAMQDYLSLVSQLEQLEQRLEDKKQEVNQVAEMIGKPPVEPSKRVNAQIVEAPNSSNAIPVGSMARALSGRGIVGR
jgi:hypothetical protein